MRHREPLESHYIGDSLRMKQILMNLLSNALKFTPPGGKLGVDIREEKRANDFAYLEFMVWDNGIGMSEEFMQRIDPLTAIHSLFHIHPPEIHLRNFVQPLALNIK